MNKGYTSFKVLSHSHSRDHLLEHAKRNGVEWDEHPHEGVNWMRASRAISGHLNKGKEFDIDNTDKESVQAMLEHYTALREHHKKTMIPHLRSVMSKLHSEKGEPGSNPIDFLDEAHEHLNSSGNAVWREKLSTLKHFNTQIARLSDKLDKA